MKYFSEWDLYRKWHEQEKEIKRLIEIINKLEEEIKALSE